MNHGCPFITSISCYDISRFLCLFHLYSCILCSMSKNCWHCSCLTWLMLCAWFWACWFWWLAWFLTYWCWLMMMMMMMVGNIWIQTIFPSMFKTIKTWEKVVFQYSRLYYGYTCEVLEFGSHGDLGKGSCNTSPLVITSLRYYQVLLLEQTHLWLPVGVHI